MHAGSHWLAGIGRGARPPGGALFHPTLEDACCGVTPLFRGAPGGPLRRLVAPTVSVGALLAGLCAGAAPARATDATWAGSGTEWTTGTNWSSTPTVPDNTATFTNNGAPQSVTISANASINTIQFTAAAPAYAFTVTDLNITGTGIVNSSTLPPSFTTSNPGILRFFNSSTAGNATITNNGTLVFFNTSTAGNATVTTTTSCSSLTPARPATPPSPTLPPMSCNSWTPARPAAPTSPTTAA
jgi:hypothetical protein